MLRSDRFANRFAMGAVALLAGIYYLWQLRAAGEKIDFAHPPIGYYNYLGRAFAHGHLYLPLEPSPELLSFANPWDPALDEKYKMHDMVYFHRRYYLYHGAGPAVLLFTPWLLLTGHDLPERFAVFLLCFAGFLFSCGVLLRWLALAGAKPGPALLAILTLALGLCGGVPYLLNRVAVYEVAIAGGYFFISAALFFLTLGMEADAPVRSAALLAASGVAFGAAIACRPHLGAPGIIAFFALLFVFRRSPRRWLAFGAAFGAIASLVPLYNYERFGNPLEFGIRYLLTGAAPIGIKLSAANLWPGAYFWLVCPPEFSGVFPWVRLIFRYPFNSIANHFPPDYFIEAMTGAVFLAPFVAGALAMRKKGPLLLWTTLASSFAVLVFLALTGFSTLRYEVDFLPMAMLVALANLAAWIEASRGVVRAALCTALAAAIGFGMVVNLALGIQGPYGEMLRTRPITYVRIARWFSPVERTRPLLNPVVHIAVMAQFRHQVNGAREPILVVGNMPYRFFFFAEHSANGLRFVSRFVDKEQDGIVAGGDDILAAVRLDFDPATRTMTASVNGQEVANFRVHSLILAPAEVVTGENHVEPGLTNERFWGDLRMTQADVLPGGAAWAAQK